MKQISFISNFVNILNVPALVDGSRICKRSSSKIQLQMPARLRIANPVINGVGKHGIDLIHCQLPHMPQVEVQTFTQSLHVMR